MKGQKKELWRIIVAIISVALIVFMWVKKDIATIYSTMPKEQLVPIIITSVVVTLVKVIGITAVILLIKWSIEKLKSRNK